MKKCEVGLKHGQYIQNSLKKQSQGVKAMVTEKGTIYNYSIT
jgi:sulfite reductase alpha subunit-like flavoprotein